MTALLTVPEAADRLGVTPELVTTLIKSGALAGVDVGAGAVPRWRVAESALESFITARTTATPTN